MNFLPFFLFLVFVEPRVVDAYIDPGTGSLIIQVVIASLAAIAFYARVFWGKIKSFYGFFLNKYKKDKKVEDTQSTQFLNEREQQD